MKSVNRRTFLAGSLGASVLSINSRLAARAKAAESSGRTRRPNPVAVSTYSFWRFKRNLKLPIETCKDKDPEDGICDKCLDLNHNMLCDDEEAKLFDLCKDKDEDYQCDECADDNHNMICDDEEIAIYVCEKDMEVRAVQMEPGLRQIKFKVRDNESRWSPVVELSTDIWVAYQFYDTYLPLVTR